MDLGSDSAIERSTERLPKRDKQELKAEYRDALKTESNLQSAISRLDEKITQVLSDGNNSSPGLLHEKETLLDELRRLNSLVRSEGEKVSTDKLKEKKLSWNCTTTILSYSMSNWDFQSSLKGDIYQRNEGRQTFEEQVWLRFLFSRLRGAGAKVVRGFGTPDANFKIPIASEDFKAFSNR